MKFVYTPDNQPIRCFSNIEMKRKAEVLAAIEASGAPVEWRDTPDERMIRQPEEYRARFGSIWAPKDADLSRMWALLRGSPDVVDGD